MGIRLGLGTWNNVYLQCWSGLLVVLGQNGLFYLLLNGLIIFYFIESL
jgi:hypothetical protein